MKDVFNKGRKVLKQLTAHSSKEVQPEILSKYLSYSANAVNSHNLVSMTDSNGVIIYANENFCRLSKYSLEELIGQTHNLINSSHHPREFFKDLWTTILAGNPWKGEIKNRAKDGSFYWVDNTVLPMINDQGTIDGFLSIRNDITIKKEFLDKKIQERTEQLSFLNDALQKENESKTRLTSKLEEVNKDITDSLLYAGRIQNAILPKHETFKLIFPDSFIYSQAKDIVSGDFLWFSYSHNTKVIVVADCTGHGVPGALLSIVTSNLLDKIVTDQEITDPALITEHLLRGFYTMLGQGAEESNLRDGIDIGIISIDESTKKIKFCGSSRSLYVRNCLGRIVEYKPQNNNISATGFSSKSNSPISQEIEISQDDTLYMTTDGFYSQFGGQSLKKFMKANFTQMLERISHFQLSHQGQIVSEVYLDWKNENAQTDDVLVIGLKPFTKRYL
jgi:PAS domain S-box-containing protein